MSGAVAQLMQRRAEGWPERLEHLREPPEELWVLGRLPQPGTPCVAVVGSRRATPGAMLTAREIGFALGAAGVTVISGMARGVDGAAHKGALDGGGFTVAVTGCGIERCYPSEHRALRERILESGCLLSEWEGTAAPLTWRFPRRNRIIAALAEAVVVVEAGARSGALSTARWANDLGREVLAVPGSIRNAGSVGSNELIRDGARPFLGMSDLYDALPWLRHLAVLSQAQPELRLTRVAPAPADPLLKRILDRLTDPVHPDDLAAALGLSMPTLAAALTTLEVRGSITEVCGGRVARTF